MDKKQAHKIGKKINKPIKIVKNNKAAFLAIASVAAKIYGTYKSNKKG